MTGPPDPAVINRAPTRAALDDVVGYRLRRLQTLWNVHWARGIRQFGLEITPMQGGTMMLIAENPGIGHSALARLLKIEAPTLSQTLTPLVDAGLVERVRAQGDGRAVALHLSQDGSQAVARIADYSLAHEDELLAGLNATERCALMVLLNKALASAAAAH
jgi:DNA-binding MarR family transcriptional regulator